VGRENTEAAMSYTVVVGFDEASHRYFVKESDVPGLNIATETFEQLFEIVKDVLPNLMENINEVKVKFERVIVL
jgi:hypothetical protein